MKPAMLHVFCAACLILSNQPMKGAEMTNAETQPTVSTLILGGGCFWCVEAVYEAVPGVLSVVSGYAGGHVENPTYEQVMRGKTGHAEVVKITFDPERVGVRRLLNLFWQAHDPTTPNRQGADVGPQYRSIILYADETQKREAEASRDAAQTGINAPIVTEIVPLEKFFPAEEYHQDFAEQNPNHPYVRAVIDPKMRKLGSKSAE